MKVHIELVEDLPEDEVVIRCSSVDEGIQRLHRAILEQASATSKIVFYKDNQEFYFPLEQVLFFETEGEAVYAHTADDSYRIHYRLYELEEALPPYFARAAKSTIVNTRRIYSITRDITASSLVQFGGTHKQVYVSRHYYKTLRQRMGAAK